MADHHVLKLDLDAAKDELVRLVLAWEANPQAHGHRRQVRKQARRVRDLHAKWTAALPPRPDL